MRSSSKLAAGEMLRGVRTKVFSTKCETAKGQGQRHAHDRFCQQADPAGTLPERTWNQAFSLIKTLLSLRWSKPAPGASIDGHEPFGEPCTIHSFSISSYGMIFEVSFDDIGAAGTGYKKYRQC